MSAIAEPITSLIQFVEDVATAHDRYLATLGLSKSAIKIVHGVEIIGFGAVTPLLALEAAVTTATAMELTVTAMLSTFALAGGSVEVAVGIGESVAQSPSSQDEQVDLSLDLAQDPIVLIAAILGSVGAADPEYGLREGAFFGKLISFGVEGSHLNHSIMHGASRLDLTIEAAGHLRSAITLGSPPRPVAGDAPHQHLKGKKDSPENGHLNFGDLNLRYTSIATTYTTTRTAGSPLQSSINASSSVHEHVLGVAPAAAEVQSPLSSLRRLPTSSVNVCPDMLSTQLRDDEESDENSVKLGKGSVLD